MLSYHIWTIGCQMNKAESEQISNFLEKLGYEYTTKFKNADLFIVNTCVVRQSAEDKVLGLLAYLKGIKNNKPDMKIIVTGCFIDSNIGQLYHKYPYINLFFKPGKFNDFYDWLDISKLSNSTSILSHVNHEKNTIFSLVSIIQGCNNFCSYCIVPYRRGKEKSREKEEIVKEVNELSRAGAKEVTLLGQNVNSYGKDLYESYRLIDLLTELHEINYLARIRFLTNHPKDMDMRLIGELSNLNKVCKHINLPIQSGNNDILKAMNRGYTREYYLELIDNIRKWIPDASLSTDVIVGYPEESDNQFVDTLDIINNIRFDVVHTAMYSPRKGTLASSRFEDNVPSVVKKERFYKIEALQEHIAKEINDKLVDTEHHILVEGKKNNRWYGRTDSNKLVFFENGTYIIGEEVKVRINKASAWALQAEITE